MKCSIINPALSVLMKHLVIGQRQKAPNFSASIYRFLTLPGTRGTKRQRFSAFHCNQAFIATRVVHVPKRTETSLITEWDGNGPNH